ncbi:ABC transporter permease [Amycolatopsis cihanbeyliensis]|uniref:Peptide/nickel transport system permease protein n=1 Tax=Amycolatopsis cihanbeyliensis TaxID=1128664 RepID=A0A542DBT5_AMYCI|nr:ABC transporter permease subunit [Amycolatopsis cihanbeyliensis]TQJ00538.1 peptide/nickel transport system permease protein [Amycolatopsis cihanbeyliensis]
MTRKLLGWGLFGLVVVLVLIGPELASHSPTEPVARPYSPPGTGGVFGTDRLGRDVASRMLHGGRPLLLTSLVAATAGSVLGALAGIFTALAAPRHRWVEAVVLRPLDTLAAVPPILMLLLVLTALPGRAGLVLAVALAGLPLSARVARAAAEQVAGRAHVEAAVARGEGWGWLIGREVLPLVAGTLLADLGLRFVIAFYLVAAAGFLGLSTSSADWGLLVVEALPGAALQPWALIVPVLGIAAIAVSVNLTSDAVSRRARGLVA